MQEKQTEKNKVKSIPITGSVLQWAIGDGGWTVDELAKKLQVKPADVMDWIAERSQPTKGQMTKLASQLDRPSAFFLLPHPPSHATGDGVAFRHGSGIVRTKTNKEEASYLRQARRLQKAAAGLLEDLGVERPYITQYVKYDWQTVSPEEAAQIERSNLGISISEQIAWPSEYAAFHNWRKALEDQQIYVFTFSMGKHSCRGFSLWHDHVPVVAVNTSFNPQNRIFTLFHEYAHLVTRTESLCAGWSMESSDDLEKWCEKFASAFLSPADWVIGEVSTGRGRNKKGFALVKYLSNKLHMSLRATAVRLIQLNLAPASLYNEVDKTAIAGNLDYNSGGGGGGGGRRAPEIRLDTYGKTLLSILYRGYDENIIGLHKLVDYTNLKPKQVTDLRVLLQPV